MGGCQSADLTWGVAFDHRAACSKNGAHCLALFFLAPQFSSSYSKLEDMHGAAASPHLLPSGLTWPVKFRLINRSTVLPSQVTTLTPPLSSPDSSFYER